MSADSLLLVLRHIAFDLLMLYGVLAGAGTWIYSWTRRMPIDASLRRLAIPELDTEIVWSLSAGGGVGIV
jgi:hypothetical protein